MNYHPFLLLLKREVVEPYRCVGKKSSSSPFSVPKDDIPTRALTKPVASGIITKGENLNTSLYGWALTSLSVTGRSWRSELPTVPQ